MKAYNFYKKYNGVLLMSTEHIIKTVCGHRAFAKHS